jgi:homocitrate synthase
LDLSDDQVKEITVRIKNLGDAKQQSIEDVDSLLRKYHHHVAKGNLKVRFSQSLP